METIGIVGSNGRLGSNLYRYFSEAGFETYGFDIKGKSNRMEQVLGAGILFLCLPTPYTEGQKGYDLSALEASIKSIPEDKLVVIKSTVTPGTTDDFQEKYPKLKFIFCPEFLTESTAWGDTLYPDANIIGTTKQSYSHSRKVLDILPEAQREFIMPAKAAEMVKIARNNYFVNKIVFMNLLYDLCQAEKIDYEPVMEALSSDRRIRRDHMQIFHQGGRGGGGTCFPKDTAAFRDWAEKVDEQAYGFIKHYVEINDALLDETGKDRGKQYEKRSD